MRAMLNRKEIKYFIALIGGRIYFKQKGNKMNNETRMELIETLIKAYSLYRSTTETPPKEQALTGAFQDEIYRLMTENEFHDWCDMGEFRPEIETIKHSFKTDRIYNFQQEIEIIIERNKITFNDPSRDIVGSFELDENDTIVKSWDKINLVFFEGESRLSDKIGLVKKLARGRTMKHYDNGTHKWLSPFEAEKLFRKETS